MDEVRESVVADDGEQRRAERSARLARTGSKLLIPLVLFAWFVFLSIKSPVFLTGENLFNVTRQVAVVGIISFAQLLCLITGNVDLSVGNFLGMFGALLAGLTLQVGLVPAFCIVLALAVVWGLVNGFLVTRGRGLSVIVTLSTMYIARGITLIYTNSIPVINFPMPYGFLGVGNIGPVPWSLITLVVVALAVHAVLRWMPAGRHLYAIGGNRQAAEVCGIAVKKIIIGVYVASALLASLAGIVLLGRIGSAQPLAGNGMELDSVATVLIGGASVSGGSGGVFSTIAGIFMLGLINNGLNLLGISGFYQYILKGVIILIAVVVDTLKSRAG